MSLYMYFCVYLQSLDSLKLALRRAHQSLKDASCILQGNQKLGVCNELNLLLGRKVGPCPGTAGFCFGCPAYHALTYMGTCNQVLCSVLKLTFLLISVFTSSFLSNILSNVYVSEE